MKIRLKTMAMDIEGGGTTVRIKSGGMICVLLFFTFVVVCFQNYVNTIASPMNSSKASKRHRKSVQNATGNQVASTQTATNH